MMKRQPDGTWRGSRQPLKLSAAVLRARWIEGETLQLKRMGLAFDAIAAQIMRVARAEAPALIETPVELSFPHDFRVSRQAVHKAFRRAIAREPALAVDELRKLDTTRSEEMFMSLQPGTVRATRAPSSSASNYSTMARASTATPRSNDTSRAARTASRGVRCNRWARMIVGKPTHKS